MKLVNIRNDDIADGNPKLTLGLIWTIILHFQVGACGAAVGPRCSGAAVGLLWGHGAVGLQWGPGAVGLQWGCGAVGLQ